MSSHKEAKPQRQIKQNSTRPRGTDTAAANDDSQQTTKTTMTTSTTMTTMTTATTTMTKTIGETQQKQALQHLHSPCAQTRRVCGNYNCQQGIDTTQSAKHVKNALRVAKLEYCGTRRGEARIVRVSVMAPVPVLCATVVLPNLGGPMDRHETLATPQCHAKVSTTPSVVDCR
jgi:hypothetical protein